MLNQEEKDIVLALKQMATLPVYDVRKYTLRSAIDLIKDLKSQVVLLKAQLKVDGLKDYSLKEY